MVKLDADYNWGVPSFARHSIDAAVAFTVEAMQEAATRARDSELGISILDEMCRALTDGKVGLTDRRFVPDVSWLLFATDLRGIGLAAEVLERRTSELPNLRSARAVSVATKDLERPRRKLRITKK